eukprot:COSAG01_NODE_7968_length_2971_cov_1.972493_4_plen_106_part_00
MIGQILIKIKEHFRSTWCPPLRPPAPVRERGDPSREAVVMPTLALALGMEQRSAGSRAAYSGATLLPSPTACWMSASILSTCAHKSASSNFSLHKSQQKRPSSTL